MALVVMARKAYCDRIETDYPNLARKVILVVLHSEKNGLYQGMPSGMPARVKFETGFSRRAVGQISAAKAACLYSLCRCRHR
jgi:hypothetical protein